MKKFAFVFLLVSFSCVQVVSSAPLDGSKYIKQQGWTEVNPVRKAVSPVPGIVPIMYFSKDASGPSCALLTQTTAAPVLLELSSSEQGEAYPECLGINDAATFKIANRNYVVFEYITRETREDNFRRYYYVVKNSSGQYESAEDLNNTDSPIPASPAKSTVNPTPRAIEGIAFARSMMTRKSMPAKNWQGRDYLVDGARSFSIFQDKTKTACTFVLDDGAKSFPYAHTQFSEGDTCTTILASGKISAKGSTYYIAMFKGSKVHLAIVSVAADGVVADNEKLAIAVSKSNNLSTMKQAKDAVVAALK